MSSKTDTSGNLADVLSARLLKLSALTQLCAFSSEARRRLNDIQRASEILPWLSKILEEHIEMRNEWIEHPEHLGLVLKFIEKEIAELNVLVNEPGCTVPSTADDFAALENCSWGDLRRSPCRLSIGSVWSGY
jgi:hypothetical protein